MDCEKFNVAPTGWILQSQLIESHLYCLHLVYQLCLSDQSLMGQGTGREGRTDVGKGNHAILSDRDIAQILHA